MSAIQADIETRLAQVEPDVEVLLAEVVGGRLVRLYIDHPNGVSLDLCERVTSHLPARAGALRARGLLARGRSGRCPSPTTSAASSAGARACAPAAHCPTGAGAFTGELLAATDDGVTVAAEGGVVSIAYADISRSNLVGD